MKVSGFTIVRNCRKFHYPTLESIQSILPICDEFIVNVGDSEDDTLEIIKTIQSDKIRIIENKWDFTQGKEVLSHQTNLALKECKGDWAFYLQSDEVIHEDDLKKLMKIMQKYLHSEEDALRFKWLHFYGSYWRYRIDKGWYQKQDRIIRNNGEIESYGDAYGFKRKDDQPLKRINTRCLLYHYGWVQEGDVMAQRRINADKIGYISLSEQQKSKEYSYVNMNRFPVYFGSHPQIMNEKVNNHNFSNDDLNKINKKYWWHAMKYFKIRYKTGRRIKEPLD